MTSTVTGISIVQPRTEAGITNVVRVASNDPITPEETIEVVTDIRALTVSSELLSPPGPIALGEAATVIVIPDPDVNVEKGYLYHRPSNGGPEFSDSIALSENNAGFVAVIPGAHVTESGLDYYIRVENSGVFATDPADAPSGFYHRAVQSPATFSTRLLSQGESPSEGRDIRVALDLPDGIVSVGAVLKFRAGGERDYRSVLFEQQGGLTSATIAGSFVTNRGVDYWVELETLTRTLTDPPGDATRSPHAIQVTVRNLQEVRSHAERRYRMFSVPLDFGSEFGQTIEALLSDQPEFGPYDPVKWRSFRYVSEQGRYVELPEDSLATTFDPRPGKAYWLISSSAHRVDTAPGVGRSTPTDRDYTIALQPGWNQIGDPFAFAVSWDSLFVDSLSTAAAEALLRIEPPVAWDSSGRYVMDVDVLQPFDGYWVRNLTPNALTLRVPPVETVAEATTARKAVASDDGWRVEIEVSADGVFDSANVAGVQAGAARDRDRFDRSEMPPNPGRAVSLYFPHTDWGLHSGRYTHDIRSDDQSQKDNVHTTSTSPPWGHLWSFDVTKSFSLERGGDDVVLEFAIGADVPAEAGVVLVDRHLARRTDLREKGIYHFLLGEREGVDNEEDARFVLVIGSPDFVEDNSGGKAPRTAVLFQNQPNPFNPSTIIRYDVSSRGMVNLSIYDVTGALVVVLENRVQEPGRYEIVWRGENARGEKMASGVFFYRLKTPHFTRARKMVLLK